MKLVDDKYEQIKAKGSIDVHLDKDDYVNIVLPTGRILTVTAKDATLFDVDESQLKSVTL